MLRKEKALERADGIALEAGPIESTQLDPVRHELAQLDPVQIDSVQIDSVRRDPVQLDSARVDPVRVDPVRREPAGIEPASGIDTLEGQLDRIDIELIHLVQRRTALAHQLRAARTEAGITRFVHERELAVVRLFRQLGPTGGDLATMLLRLSR